MEIETRLLEEWKANNDLLKFYEDLKQKRFAHFLTIQTAFLAFFALLAKDALLSLSMVSLTALVLIAIPPLIISFYFIRVDTRSRAFVDTTNTRLLLIEDEWRGVSPNSHFSTYRQTFAILSRHDEEAVEKYLARQESRRRSVQGIGTVEIRPRQRACNIADVLVALDCFGRRGSAHPSDVAPVQRFWGVS